MSEKVILSKDNRQTKQVKLSRTGITLEIYPSLLLSETEGLDIAKLSDGEVSQIRKILTKLIKSWNAYANEKDEDPLPINEENVGLIHANDLPDLIKEISEARLEEKKT